MSRIKYILRDTRRLIWRHFGMSLLTIFTAMSVFFVVGAMMLFILNVKTTINTLEDQLSIQVYIKPSGNLKAVADKIKTMSNVRSVSIITKEMALERLRARLGNQSDAVTLLGENPLPSSIEIKVDSAAGVPDTARELVTIDEVDDIVYAGKVAEKLMRLSTFVEHFSLVVLIIALVTSAIVLFNTIRISIYSRAEEISVMLKVGATSTYVAFPFVIQGFLLGFLGSLSASCVLAVLYFRAVEAMTELLPFFKMIESVHYLGKLALVLISGGTVVSLLASLVAVEKFIRKAGRPL
ncbi:MAG: permease-like cell division protein FtsX [Synergistes sp.]|nr:permease-like cell division protein FtsX [Synergistes sp.]